MPAIESHAVYGPWNTPLRNLQIETRIDVKKDYEYIEYGANVRVGFYEVPRMVQVDPLKRKQIMISMEGATKIKLYEGRNDTSLQPSFPLIPS